MEYIKYDFIHFFRSQTPRKLSDFIAIKVEKYNFYIVIKCKKFKKLNNIEIKYGSIIEENLFTLINKRSKSQIILNDTYIDISEFQSSIDEYIINRKEAI
jgi:phage FluMu protein Com